MKRIYIEITNICNLSCAFCTKTKRKQGAISVKQFQHILNEVSPICKYIYLHVLGEPFLHPELESLFLLCDQYDMQVQLTTNGTYISKASTILQHPSLRKISISMHSIPFQKDLTVQEYFENINTFLQTKKNHVVYTDLRFWRSQDDLPQTKQLLEQIQANYQLEPTSKQDSYKIAEHTYVSFENGFTWPKLSDNTQPSIGRCHGAIDQLAILVDGTVVPCCLDADGNIPLGNIYTESLESIMKSEQYLSLCKQLQNNKIHEPLCQNCTYRFRFSKDK